MIKEAIGFGETIDEAKERAIADLNAADDEEIQFEVISTPKKKTLGLFGGKRAEVRVYVELPDEKPKTAKKTTAKSEKKPVKKAQKTERAPKAEAKPTVKTQNNEKDGYGEMRDAAEFSADTKAGIAVNYLKGVLNSLGCEITTIKVAEKDNAALIELDGEGMGVIIGRRGEVLDSLQYLTSLAASNGGGYYKISLNIGNFREKREEALANLATRIASQVLKTGKSRALEPMNPYERRIIHSTVQGIEGVTSGSFGEGSARRVVIGLEGKELRPPRRENSRRDGGRSRRPVAKTVDTPAREPKKDSDIPLYGKIN